MSKDVEEQKFLGKEALFILIGMLLRDMMTLESQPSLEIVFEDESDEEPVDVYQDILDMLALLSSDLKGNAALANECEAYILDHFGIEAHFGFEKLPPQLHLVKNDDSDPPL